MPSRLVARTCARLLRLAGFEALGWDQQFKVTPGCYGARSPHTVRRVEALCGGGDLLEFGCGEGDLPVSLAPGTFSSYLGYDISGVAVGRARVRAAQRGLARTRFEQGDMARWDGAARASLIVAEECLYYLPVPAMERFLARCMRALEAGGAMLVIVHSADKHAATLDVCRRACLVVDEMRVGSRVFLTLQPRPPTPPRQRAADAQATC